MAAPMHFEESVLYAPGDHGYRKHRIPALLTTATGTILAFTEARRFTGRDSDQVDLFLRRSVDGGKSFGEVQVVATQEGWVSGNPAPVLDRTNGTVWLLFCRNPSEESGEHRILAGDSQRTVWITSSTDDGATWSEPREITNQVKIPGWTWYATGPCHGIQLESGRLVVPCDHVVGDNHDYAVSGHSHIIYSDDHGAAWNVGGIAQAGTNESVIIQNVDGSLYLNCRNFGLEGAAGRPQYRRAYARSIDEGNSFSECGIDDKLVEPVCQAGMVRLTSVRVGGDRNRILFSNPAGVADGMQIRCELTVRLSYDECRSWPVARVIYSGPSAYSDLCIATDGAICCLYERGEEGGPDSSGSIALARFNIEWLTDGPK